MVATRPRRTSAATITYIVLNQFQGGINAQRDKVQIQLGQCVMARNVEWQEHGGFFIRQGVGPLTSGTGVDMDGPGHGADGYPVGFYHYVQDPSGTAAFTSQYLVPISSGKVMVGVDYGAAVPPATGTAFTPVVVGGTPISTVGVPAMAVEDKNLYISLGSQALNSLGLNMTRWNGATATALGKTFNDDYTNPVGGNMPPARFIAMWQGRVWTGVQLHDSAAIDGSVIRWSHPGHPEDWATDDYITIGAAGDVITGLAPMRDMLVVFKRNSTYALLGSGASNFRLIEVSRTVGCTGQFTNDNQGAIMFWDATIGLCRFDGRGIDNVFLPLRDFLSQRPPAITTCGGVVTDGDKVYVVTDFNDIYGSRVPDPLLRTLGPALLAGTIVPGQVTWQAVIDAGWTWGQLSAYKWLTASQSYYSMVWVYRPGAGWTSFTLNHPDALRLTCVGQLRSRVSAAGVIDSNRRIVYGLSNKDVPMYLSDRFDDGKDHWANDNQRAIDAFYMTGWLTGGIPAGVKRFRAPYTIQEADAIGNLLIDVYYDYNYNNLRRTLKVPLLTPLSSDSYMVTKPGTLGRARSIMLIIRPEVDAAFPPRHWGVSSITIPVNPKVMR